MGSFRYELVTALVISVAAKTGIGRRRGAKWGGEGYLHTRCALLVLVFLPLHV
jgi:hypothetical protein